VLQVASPIHRSIGATWKHVHPEDDGVQASPGVFARDFESLVLAWGDNGEFNVGADTFFSPDVNFNL
jgi:hypothetical protein